MTSYLSDGNGSWGECFGGREGCMWFLFPPTMRETLANEAKKMKRTERRLKRQMDSEAIKLKNAKRNVVKLAEKKDKELARQAALELHRSRILYRRMGHQKNNAARIGDKIDQQLRDVSNDRGMLLVTLAMCNRFDALNPARFAQFMQQYDALSTQQRMNEDTFERFMSKGEDDELERDDAEDASDELRVRAIFEELGVADIVAGVPPQQPAGAAPKGGGGGGGGMQQKQACKAYDIEGEREPLLVAEELRPAATDAENERVEARLMERLSRLRSFNDKGAPRSSSSSKHND